LQIEIIFIGIFAGLFAGMFGVGGGIVIIPALILIFGWEMHLTAGTTLATLLFPTGILALLQYKRANLLNIKVSALIALGIVFGNIFGATVALQVDGEFLKQLFGVFLIFIGIKHLKILQFFKNKKNEIIDEKQDDSLIDFQKTSKQILIFTGIITGFLAGLFGIGGGIIIVTILIGIYKINPKQAVAISLAAMFLPVGIGGVLLYNQANFVNILAAIKIAIGMEIGSAISAKIAIGIDIALLKRLFGFMLILLGLYFISEKYIFGW